VVSVRVVCECACYVCLFVRVVHVCKNVFKTCGQASLDEEASHTLALQHEHSQLNPKTNLKFGFSRLNSNIVFKI